MSAVPKGMSAMEWHRRQLAARAVAKLDARESAIAMRKEEDAELRRRCAVTPVVSPLQGLVDKALKVLRGGDDDPGDGVSWW